MQHCYHEMCDNLEVMLTEDNIAFLEKITDSLISTIDDMSERNPMPCNIFSSIYSAIYKSHTYIYIYIYIKS